MLELDRGMFFGTDGSGNQKKVWINNKLIKLDSKFREASKEVSVSYIGNAFGLDCVMYSKDTFTVDNKECHGCICDSYLSFGETTVSLIEILNFYAIDIPRNMSAVDYFNITVNAINNFTGLGVNNIQIYLMNMLVLDFLVANPDRHLSNIEFIRGSYGFRFTPYFDFGQSFFKKDSVLTFKELESYSRKFKTLPFSTNQYKNLINLEVAKNIALRFKANAEFRYGSLLNIPNVLEGHNKVLRYRLNLLLDKK